MVVTVKNHFTAEIAENAEGKNDECDHRLTQINTDRITR
jgi:hypothetical protein